MQTSNQEKSFRKSVFKAEKQKTVFLTVQPYSGTKKPYVLRTTYQKAVCLWLKPYTWQHCLQILCLNYLLINYKLLKITIFPFKSIVFTFPILLFVSTGVSLRDSDPFVHGPNSETPYISFNLLIAYCHNIFLL